MDKNVRHVFIIGSKGIPARYGGFETFVQELVRRKKSDRIFYHVACSLEESMILDSKRVFYYEGAQCFVIPMWTIGAGKAIVYDLEALKFCAYYIERAGIKDAAVYVLACRVGPFFEFYCRKLRKLGAYVYLNPDGHEWKRAKWNYWIKKYWKYSEKRMVQSADYVICDSMSIRKYINTEYRKYHPHTGFIPYGADVTDKDSEQYCRGLLRAREWLAARGLEPGGYYLIVGRFVPENNYETMLKEFRKSVTKRSLLIITNVEESPFLSHLREATRFEEDKRILFPGTVYDSELLGGIRSLAWAYLHGHSVGGTNPSLLESLGMTRINLLFDVSFNREVGEDSALYWDLEKGSLSRLLNSADGLSEEQAEVFGRKARDNIEKRYSWNSVVARYEKLFLEGPVE